MSPRGFPISADALYADHGSPAEEPALELSRLHQMGNSRRAHFVMGGSPEQSCQAASSAMQNVLGTICDPVAGLVQIPCINRNAMSAANAVVSANMSMGGFDPLIPLDQTAETLFRVGRQLPSELRCTCRGGLCTTPCGQQLAKEQLERDNRR